MGDEGPDRYDDDQSFEDGAVAYRRVNPNWINWGVQDEAGNPRVTSQAFQDCTPETAQRLGVPAPGMSLALSGVLERLGFEPDKILEPVDESYGVVALEINSLRSLNQGVQRWPTDSESWHAIVFDRSGTRRAKSICTAVAALASWVIVPTRR